jgi:hypothetical protein
MGVPIRADVQATGSTTDQTGTTISRSMSGGASRHRTTGPDG